MLFWNFDLQKIQTNYNTPYYRTSSEQTVTASIELKMLIIAFYINNIMSNVNLIKIKSQNLLPIFILLFTCRVHIISKSYQIPSLRGIKQHRR
jgi:hypothetical protein